MVRMCMLFMSDPTVVCVLQGGVHERVTCCVIVTSFSLYMVMLRALLVLFAREEVSEFPPDLCHSFTIHFRRQYVNCRCVVGHNIEHFGHTYKRDKRQTLEWPRVREYPHLQLVKQLQRQQQYQVSRVEPDPSAPEIQSNQQEENQEIRSERELRREEVSASQMMHVYALRCCNFATVLQIL